MIKQLKKKKYDWIPLSSLGFQGRAIHFSHFLKKIFFFKSGLTVNDTAVTWPEQEPLSSLLREKGEHFFFSLPNRACADVLLLPSYCTIIKSPQRLGLRGPGAPLHFTPPRLLGGGPRLMRFLQNGLRHRTACLAAQVFTNSRIYWNLPPRPKCVTG